MNDSTNTDINPLFYPTPKHWPHVCHYTWRELWGDIAPLLDIPTSVYLINLIEKAPIQFQPSTIRRAVEKAKTPDVIKLRLFAAYERARRLDDLPTG